MGDVVSRLGRKGFLTGFADKKNAGGAHSSCACSATGMLY